MDDAALHSRLERIERRQTIGLALLVGLYLVSGLWLLVRYVPTVTGWTVAAGVVGLAVLVTIAGIYRRRRARA